MTDKQVAVIIANYARQLAIVADPLLELSAAISIGLSELEATEFKVKFDSLKLEFDEALTRIAIGMQNDAMMLSNGDAGYNYDKNRS